MMDWLMTWMHANYPTSKLGLMALLPNGNATVTVDQSAANAAYAQIAARHSALFVDCAASGYDPSILAHSKDGTHPAPAGNKLVLECLKTAVGKYI